MIRTSDDANEPEASLAAGAPGCGYTSRSGVRSTAFVLCYLVFLREKYLGIRSGFCESGRRCFQTVGLWNTCNKTGSMMIKGM